MRFRPVPGVYKAQLFYDIGGYGACNVLHFSYDGGPPDPATCALIAQDMGDRVIADLTPNWSNEINVINVVITDLSSDTGASGQFLGPLTGAVAESIVANQVAFVTKWPVSLRYRGGHPKTFWPSLRRSEALDSSNWTNPQVGANTTNIRAFIDSFIGLAHHGTTTTTAHVAVSYFLAHGERLVPLVLELGAAVGNPKMGSQRRRRDQPISI